MGVISTKIESELLQAYLSQCRVGRGAFFRTSLEERWKMRKDGYEIPKQDFPFAKLRFTLDSERTSKITYQSPYIQHASDEVFIPTSNYNYTFHRDYHKRKHRV